ncbi:MAG: hypothetical protein C9356_07375 [Oleiphilus sp.]|nr:MAG: hypothetical protein C9356_07375 [Oleiphilus sp.]
MISKQACQTRKETICSRLILVFWLAMILGACSGKQVYQVIQENRLQSCEQEMHRTVYEDCKARYGQSYEEYEEQRL